jgi:hypothetical protein
MKNKKIYIGGLIILVIILFVANYQNIFKKVFPPSPVIVSSQADGSSSSLFDYSIKVTGEVSNKGGDGYVVVEAIAYQNDNEWKKTTTIQMESYQTGQFEFIFDEVKFLTSEPKYAVRTYPLGSE